jgi:phage gpG-like protein
MAPGEWIRVEIDAAHVRFRIHESALRELLRGPSGPVMRDLARLAVRVESSAKMHATGRPGPKVRTGRLRGSITWRLGEDYLGPYADIGTAVHYAPFVELGTSRAPAYPFLRPALLAARA